jgi:hypothetical protein
MQPTSEQRSEYVAGLRALADLLETNADVPLPFDGDADEIKWITVTGENQRAVVAAIVRALPGLVQKKPRGDVIDFVGKIHGLRLCVIANRDEVCTRRVVGTREVTKTVPDPSVAVPLVEVTETEEIVEWTCGSLLGPAPQKAVSS